MHLSTFFQSLEKLIRLLPFNDYLERLRSHLLSFFHFLKYKEAVMKFMVTWRVHPDKRQATFDAFSQMTAEDDKKDMGGKIKLIGRWHDLSEFTGVAICECDDAQAMGSWILNWNNALNVKTTVVLDDAEAREVGKKKRAEIASAKPTAAAN
jgi:hypothetical protein